MKILKIITLITCKALILPFVALLISAACNPENNLLTKLYKN